MKIDAICLTKTADDSYYDMCSKTISTLFESQPDIEFNLVLIESANSRENEYRSIKAGNPNNKIIKSWDCIQNAADFLGKSASSISRSLKDGNKFALGFKWEYVN